MQAGRTAPVRAGKVLTQAVWGHAINPQFLRGYVRSFEPDPEGHEYILNQTGVGYRMRPPE